MFSAVLYCHAFLSFFTFIWTMSSSKYPDFVIKFFSWHKIWVSYKSIFVFPIRIFTDLYVSISEPLPPTSLIVSDAGTDYLYFTWKTDSQSTQDVYRVTVTEINNNSEIFKSDSISVKYHNATGLDPGSLYNIAVQSISNGEVSNGTARILDNTSMIWFSINKIQFRF